MVVTALTPTGVTPTPTVGATTTDHLIRTSAVGEVVSSPDRAEIQVGVETENADVRVAQSQNAERMTNVTNAMKALGIPDDHLTTTGYTVTPVYDTGPTPVPLALGQRKPTTYRVSNTLLVRVDDVAQVGAVIDAAVASGANQVNSIAFLYSEEKRRGPPGPGADPGREPDADRRRDRRVRARRAASRRPSGPGRPGRDADRLRHQTGTAADMAAPSTPIQPGTLKVTASVQVAWAYA